MCNDPVFTPPDQQQPPSINGIDWIAKAYWQRIPSGPALLLLTPTVWMRGQHPLHIPDRLANAPKIAARVAKAFAHDHAWPRCKAQPTTGLLYTLTISGNTNNIATLGVPDPWWCRHCNTHHAPHWMPAPSAHNQIGEQAALLAWVNKHT